MPKDRKTKTQFVDQSLQEKKNSAPKKNSAKKGDTSACPKSGAKNKAQRAQRPQDGNSIWRDQKVSNQKNSAAKKHHQKRDTVCPKSGAKNKAQRAQRTQDGNILETKSPQEKNSAAKKYRQKRGHRVSQKTRHDVPRTRKPKTHLGDEGVPRAHHPFQLPIQLLLPGCCLLLNITGETKHRAAKSRRDDASQKNKGRMNENGTKT